MSTASLDSFLEVKEMVRCAQLYYRQHKQQREIAAELNISTSKVSRLLKRADSEGLIQVEFKFPHLEQLGSLLTEQFTLRDAVVIPSGIDSELKDNLGMTAARYFERFVRSGAKVGLSCGFTLYYMVKHLKEGLLQNLEIYPLAAESTIKSVDILPNTLVGMMAAKYRPHVTAYALPAQFVSSLEEGNPERQAFWAHPEVRDVYVGAHNVDVAVIGVGAIDPGTPGFCALASQYGYSPEQLKTAGAVGEFNYQLIDAQGKAVQLAEQDETAPHVIGVPLERLQQMSSEQNKTVIAIGGGAPKVVGIRAVLRGGMCNVLITDSETAEALLGV